MDVLHQKCRRHLSGARLVAATVLVCVLVGQASAIGAQSAAPVAPIGGAKQPAFTTLPMSALGIAPVATPDSNDVAALVEIALEINPAIRAARQRVIGARARVTPAGLLPDPMVMAGIQNLPLGRESPAPEGHGATPPSSGPDPMTMKMIGIGQSLPYPGKLALRRRVAARGVEAAEAALAAATFRVKQEVRSAYYDLVFMDRALDIVERNQRLLVDFISITETRYGVGEAGQQDVLKARVEASRLAESAVGLMEDRRAVLARLNALLDRPSETPVTNPHIPSQVARAAVADSVSRIRFVSAALGSRAADSPVPPLDDLQATALRESPMLREHQAVIAAQAARVELAGKEHLPDFDLSLQYGQRGGGLPDMVTAIVSVPVPILKGRKQDQFVAEAHSELAALEAERDATKNEILAEVARLHSALERQRAQLALYVKATIPQGRASLASATSSYQVGRVEFLTVLDNQSTLFTYETEYFRSLTDFAKTLAELERVVGREIIQ